MKSAIILISVLALSVRSSNLQKRMMPGAGANEVIGATGNFCNQLTHQHMRSKDFLNLDL